MFTLLSIKGHHRLGLHDFMHDIYGGNEGGMGEKGLVHTSVHLRNP